MNPRKYRFWQFFFQRFQCIEDDIFLIFGFYIDVIFDAFDVQNIVKQNFVLLPRGFNKDKILF